MPLNSVQQYVRSQLENLTVPQNATPDVYIAPPVPGDAAVPQLYVWGGQLTETRETMPRGGGRKLLRWTVSIFVYSPDEADAPNIDTAFPVLLDTLAATFRAITLPVALTDSVTGAQSEILFIGEDMTIHYGQPRALQDQRYIWQNAVIQATVVELLQA